MQVAVHNHPLYATVWADIGEVPPAMDQSSALGGGGDIVLVDEYDGAANDSGAADEKERPSKPKRSSKKDG